MEIFNLGIAKTSVTPENPLFPNPVLPKTSVYSGLRLNQLPRMSQKLPY